MIERSIPSQDGREKNSTRQVFSILKSLFYNLYDVGFILSPHQSSEFGQRKTWTALPLPSPSGLLPELFLMWKSQTFCNNQFLKPCNALIAKSCAKFISWLWKQFFLMLIWDQYSSLIATLGHPASISKLQWSCSKSWTCSNFTVITEIWFPNLGYYRFTQNYCIC